MVRLKEIYRNDVVNHLQDQFGYPSVMAVPGFTKIVVNMGIGDAVADKKILENAMKDLETVAGQKPVVTKARKSIAGFKIREGWPIGCKVTLRKDRMYEFLDRLINIAIPRIRDFRGYSSKAFDGNGNYTLGLKEQIVFPEIDYDRVDRVRGMDITICTSAQTDQEAQELLKQFGFPFK